MGHSVRDGTGRSFASVVNSHKMMMVPLDCSLFYTRHPEVLRNAFSLGAVLARRLAGPSAGEVRQRCVCIERLHFRVKSR